MEWQKKNWSCTKLQDQTMRTAISYLCASVWILHHIGLHHLSQVTHTIWDGTTDWISSLCASKSLSIYGKASMTKRLDWKYRSIKELKEWEFRMSSEKFIIIILLIQRASKTPLVTTWFLMKCITTNQTQKRRSTTWSQIRRDSNLRLMQETNSIKWA